MKQSLWCCAAVAAALAQAAGAAGPASAAASAVPGGTAPLAPASVPAPAAASLSSQLHAVIDEAQQDKLRKNGSDHQKIADFYASYMDVEHLDKLGYRPLIAELQRVRMLRDRRGLPHVIAHFIQLGVPMPYTFAAVPDLEQGTHYVASLAPAPDVRKGAKPDDVQHIEKLMALAGNRSAADSARAAVALDNQLARLATVARIAAAAPSASAGEPAATPVVTSTTAAETSTVAAVISSTAGAQAVAIDKLAALAPGYDWQYALGTAGIAAKTDSITVVDPAFLAGFAQLAAEADIDSWKAYLEWQLLRSFAPYLSKEFADTYAAHAGGTRHDRAEEGVRIVSAALRDQVGKQYVAHYLPPDRRARLERMVTKQLAACRDPFARLGGNELAARLAALRPQLGAPARWRDTNSLMVSPKDLVANVMRAKQLEFYRLLAMLGKPIDDDDWPVGAQSADLVYDAQRNVLILPAGALRALPDEEPGRTNLLGSMIGNAIAATIDNSVVAAQLKQACSTPIHR